MQISCVLDRQRGVGKLLMRGPGAVLLALSLGAVAIAQDGSLVLERAGRTISLEPYAPNILRVTMSAEKARATGSPGDGFVAADRKSVV